MNNAARAHAFLRVFDATPRKPGATTSDERQLLRGTVVFAVGTLDAFLHDLVLELVPQFGTMSDSLAEALKSIAKESPSLSLRVALAPDPAAGRDIFRQALDEWLSDKAFHGPRNVQRALGYIGCAISWSEFDIESQMNAAAELERFTNMRHDIVHRGRSPAIQRQSAQNCVTLVRAMARLVNRKAVQLYWS